MKYSAVFFMLLILIFIALPVSAEQVSVPELSFDYFDGNVITNTHNEGMDAGAGFRDSVNDTTELGGYLLGFGYPFSSFTFSLEYGSGKTKDVDGIKRRFELSQVQAAYHWIDQGGFRCQPYLGWLKLTADGTDSSGALFGANLQYDFPKVIINGSFGNALGTVYSSQNYKDSKLFTYRIDLQCRLNERLSLDLGYRSYRFSGKKSVSNDADNYSECSMNGKEKFYTMGLTYRFAAKRAVADKSVTQTAWFLKPVFFDSNASIIRDDQRAALDANVEIVKAHPDWYILVGGHSDETGNREYNLELSRKRAETVRDYLTAQGVAPDRITVYAYGEDYPVTGTNELKWNNNRWVDVVLVNTTPRMEQGIRTSSQQ
jgi:outer membrane protein OmpA-like peptidoglycan-associated protein